jgi:glycosyltransferase involved in cell wall biosynthesis
MKIGIDARSILGTPTGVGRYLSNLLDQFRSLDTRNTYILYIDRPCATPLIDQENFQQKTLTLPVAQNYFTWNHFRLPPEIWRHPVDLFHFPFYTMPVIRTYRSIVSIHDITYEVHPEWYSWKGRLAMRAFSKFAARQADIILTCSLNTKHDLMEHYGISEKKIIVTYYGVEARFRPLDDQVTLANLRKRYSITARQVVLYVGSIHTRRNVEQLIRAFQSVSHNTSNVQLLIVGKREYPYLDIETLIDELDLGDLVLLPGYVRDDDLPGLYNLADVCIYPSSYEGFGFPVLEAMACGTPVITSNTSSLPEVSGDAALLIDPLNIAEMADALSQLLHNSDLRRQCIERGLERARFFSWEHTARQTLEVYRQFEG